MEQIALTPTADVLRRVRTLADIATEQLRQEILAGSLSPGDLLQLQPIAESLGMSITPVREALKRLVDEGFVEIDSSRIGRVALIDASELKDVYEVRILIEGYAIRKAVPRLDKRGFERISRALASYSTASEAEQIEAAREAHQEFHFAIYEASGSAWAMRCIQPLWNNSERYQHIARSFRGSPQERVNEHAAILAACRSRDVEGAVQVLTAHLERSLDLVRTVLQSRTKHQVSAPGDGATDDLGFNPKGGSIK